MLYIYVLQLQNDKYYVGKTTNPHFRFDNHFTSNGCEWTKLHKPIKILELIPNCDDYDEEKYTYKYMDKYGIDNVRGGSSSSVILDAETKKQLRKISNSINDRCFICGKTDGHFAKECSNNVYNIIHARDKGCDYIPLETLLTYTPCTMLVNIKDIEIIKRLKKITIKLGDNILLNYKKNEYSSLKELVEDACDIFNNYDDTDLARIPTITSIEHAKSLRKYLLSSKIGFYTQVAELLDQLSEENCKLLQSGCTFKDIENNILYSIRK
jgi:hypothetical protein